MISAFFYKLAPKSKRHRVEVFLVIKGNGIDLVSTLRAHSHYCVLCCAVMCNVLWPPIHLNVLCNTTKNQDHAFPYAVLQGHSKVHWKRHHIVQNACYCELC